MLNYAGNTTYRYSIFFQKHLPSNSHLLSQKNNCFKKRTNNHRTCAFYFSGKHKLWQWLLSYDYVKWVIYIEFRHVQTIKGKATGFGEVKVTCTVTTSGLVSCYDIRPLLNSLLHCMSLVNSSTNSQPSTVNVWPGLSNQIRQHALFHRYLCQSINKKIQNISTNRQSNSNQRSLL